MLSINARNFTGEIYTESQFTFSGNTSISKLLNIGYEMDLPNTLVIVQFISNSVITGHEFQIVWKCVNFSELYRYDYDMTTPSGNSTASGDGTTSGPDDTLSMNEKILISILLAVLVVAGLGSLTVWYFKCYKVATKLRATKSMTSESDIYEVVGETGVYETVVSMAAVKG